MKKSEEGMKILSLVVENFKNIEKTDVDFAGRSAIIIGKNGAGKSSLIQAICSPIDANYLPAKPIKKGEERGSIELKIGGNLHGEEEVYTLGLYFSKEHKKGRITITNSDGEKVSGGKKLISEIVGNIGFDIQEFIKLGVTANGSVSKPGVQEQIEILKKLMPVDVLKEMYKLDHEYEKTYEARADVNKDIKLSKAKLESHEFSQEELDFYKELIDTKKIVSKMSNIEKELEDFNKVDNGTRTAYELIPQIEQEITELKEKLEKATNDLASVKERHEKGVKWLEGKTKPSIEVLNDKLSNANQHNVKVKEINDLENSQVAIRALETDSETKTERLLKIKEEKKAIFASSPLPVEGLTFDDEGIFYKELPFNDTQHPSSLVIGIGVKISQAMNPNLRMIVIRDGSLLDEKTLSWLIKDCEKNNYQLFIEKVSESEEVDIEFVES